MKLPWVSRRAYELVVSESALQRQEIRELRDRNEELFQRLLDLTVQAPAPPPERRPMRVIPQRMTVDMAGKRLEREFRKVAASADFLGKGDA